MISESETASSFTTPTCPKPDPSSFGSSWQVSHQPPALVHELDMVNPRGSRNVHGPPIKCNGPAGRIRRKAPQVRGTHRCCVDPGSCHSADRLWPTRPRSTNLEPYRTSRRLHQNGTYVLGYSGRFRVGDRLPQPPMVLGYAADVERDEGDNDARSFVCRP